MIEVQFAQPIACVHRDGAFERGSMLYVPDEFGYRWLQHDYRDPTAELFSEFGFSVAAIGEMLWLEPRIFAARRKLGSH